MIAFTMRDGRAVPCEYQGARRLVDRTEWPLAFARTPHERRRRARRKTRGRRGARPVAGGMLYTRRVEVEVAHPIDLGSASAILYLQKGATPSAEHIAAVDRALVTAVPGHAATVGALVRVRVPKPGDPIPQFSCFFGSREHAISILCSICPELSESEAAEIAAKQLPGRRFGAVAVLLDALVHGLSAIRGVPVKLVPIE